MKFAIVCGVIREGPSSKVTFEQMPKRSVGSVDVHGKDISVGGNSRCKGPEMFKKASKPTCCSHVGQVETGEAGRHGAGALKVCFFFFSE